MFMVAADFLTTCQTVFSEMPFPQGLTARQTHRKRGPLSTPAAASHTSRVSFTQIGTGTDRVQLQQVAMNLIVNSIEAMKDLDRLREMVIKAQLAESERILVSVSDTGPGFPPDRAEQIFDPFFTTKPHGTGMGLRISRSIIESHGGRLWAEGAPGRGATFHLNLPAAIPGH